MSDDIDIERILSIDHAPNGFSCTCGAEMKRMRQEDELGFLWKFDHEAHRAHVASIIAGGRA